MMKLMAVCSSDFDDPQPPCRAYRLLPHLADTDSHGSTYMITSKFRGRILCVARMVQCEAPKIDKLVYKPQ